MASFDDQPPDWLRPYEGPVENHPGTAKLRARIEILERFPATPERDACLEFCRDEVRRFNAGVYEYRAREFLAAERRAP